MPEDDEKKVGGIITRSEQYQHIFVDRFAAAPIQRLYRILAMRRESDKLELYEVNGKMYYSDKIVCDLIMTRQTAESLYKILKTDFEKKPEPEKGVVAKEGEKKDEG